MARRFFLTNRGASGWCSPALAARTDWIPWKHSLTRAENVVLPPQGGAKKRPVLNLVSPNNTSANGVKRLFAFDKNDREKFVLGLKASGTANQWTAVSLAATGDEAVQGEATGTLTLTDIDSARAFHYADSLLFTQLDGQVVPQRILLEGGPDESPRLGKGGDVPGCFHSNHLPASGDGGSGGDWHCLLPIPPGLRLSGGDWRDDLLCPPRQPVFWRGSRAECECVRGHHHAGRDDL